MSDTVVNLRCASYKSSAVSDEETPKVNIMVVDDLPEKLLVYKTILEELNQNLFMVTSGGEALKLVLKYEFAVILLDVNMPGMDGFETASMIRSRKKSAHMPIIFLTAFTDEMDKAQGYASGAVDYLPTPVVPEILKAKVRVFIELSQMREQAAIQAEERAKRTAAEESDRRKDEFLGMLAHELRNPLGPILNGVHLLHMMLPQDERMDALQKMIDRQVHHMVRIVDDLLDTTRLARGLILLRKENCDLGTIVRQITDDYRDIFRSKDISFSVEIPSFPVWIDGDQTRLTQAIGNLLHNAHKFTEPGGCVSVDLSCEGNTSVITVQDNGIGIEENILPQIFDVFRQGEQGLDRSRGGLGLGLTLVKGLAELHNGAVHASSDGLGTGSIFKISLPRGKTPALAEVENAVFDKISPQSKPRIVIIEDNKDTVDTIELLLVMEGYDVRVAYTGEEGLQIVQSFRPQIILCDIGLPGMDGHQIARIVRQDPDLCAPYMIALSGYGRNEDQRRSHEAGFDLHLTKPVDYNDLCRVFSNIPKGNPA